jgi:flagellar biosynthesis protein FlhG
LSSFDTGGQKDQASGLRQMVQQPKKKKNLRVIAITSGKGGVGKSNLTANLAIVAAREGRKVLILDADLGLANTEIILGVQPRHHIGELCDGIRTLNEVITPGPHGISLLSGGQRMVSMTKEQQLRLLTELEQMENRFDFVLIDSGAGLGDSVRFFVGAAQEAILVVSPEPTSLADAYAAVKTLSSQVSRFHVVVNPAQDEAAARNVFDKLTQVTGRFLKAEVGYLGCIPHDHNLKRAVMWQRPLVELFPSSPASEAVRTLYHQLEWRGPQSNPHGGLKFLWQQLLRDSMETKR